MAPQQTRARLTPGDWGDLDPITAEASSAKRAAAEAAAAAEAKAAAAAAAEAAAAEAAAARAAVAARTAPPDAPSVPVVECSGADRFTVEWQLPAWADREQVSLSLLRGGTQRLGTRSICSCE